AIAEADDARMLEEAADDALHADVGRKARNAGAQATNAADDEINHHSGLARAVERIDDCRVDEGVELRPDRGRAPCTRVQDLLLDVLDEPRPEAARRDRNSPKLSRFGVAGQIVEELRGIERELGIVAEK